MAGYPGYLLTRRGPGPSGFPKHWVIEEPVQGAFSESNKVEWSVTVGTIPCNEPYCHPGTSLLVRAAGLPALLVSTSV